MSKICIITDSSVSLFPEEAKKLGIEIAPLSVMVDGVEYKDFLDIGPKEIINALNAKKDLKTSQPNLGFHYNIQIHFPATTDISVYNAIFKSLKDNLLI